MSNRETKEVIAPTASSPENVMNDDEEQCECENGDTCYVCQPDIEDKMDSAHADV